MTKEDDEKRSEEEASEEDEPETASAEEETDADETEGADDAGDDDSSDDDDDASDGNSDDDDADDDDASDGDSGDDESGEPAASAKEDDASAKKKTAKKSTTKKSSKASAGGERGLFSIVFDPDYGSSNNYFYVSYTDNNGDSVISRFTASSPTFANSNTEEILLEVEQDFANHNGGGLAFGADGMLYASFGDGGSAADREAPVLPQSSPTALPCR